MMTHGAVSTYLLLHWPWIDLYMCIYMNHVYEVRSFGMIIKYSWDFVESHTHFKVIYCMKYGQILNKSVSCVFIIAFFQIYWSEHLKYGNCCIVYWWIFWCTILCKYVLKLIRDICFKTNYSFKTHALII